MAEGNVFGLLVEKETLIIYVTLNNIEKDIGGIFANLIIFDSDICCSNTIFGMNSHKKNEISKGGGFIFEKLYYNQTLFK